MIDRARPTRGPAAAGPKARLVNFALRRARQLVGLRESPKYLLIVALGAAAGPPAARSARRWSSGGAIDGADDIFFLDFAEARRGLAASRLRDGGGRTARGVRGRNCGGGTSPGAAVRRHRAGGRRRRGQREPDGALAGSPASPGTVTGPARVVLDPVGAHLEPGEILVAPSTDPGWTPLFLTAGGLVMEMGGANSHGAVVAREYGIPAVVGVPERPARSRPAS